MEFNNFYETLLTEMNTDLNFRVDINLKLDEIATDLKDAMGRLEAGQRVMDLEDWS